jgi:hypothetical protein
MWQVGSGGIKQDSDELVRILRIVLAQSGNRFVMTQLRVQLPANVCGQLLFKWHLLCKLYF